MAEAAHFRIGDLAIQNLRSTDVELPLLLDVAVFSSAENYRDPQGRESRGGTRERDPKEDRAFSGDAIPLENGN